MQFPRIKNIIPTTIASTLLSVQPAPMDKNHVMVGDEMLDKRTGDCIMSYSHGEQKFKFLDSIHSFGMGWAIANESGEMIYLSQNEKEYSRLAQKREEPESQRLIKIRILKYEIDVLKNRLDNPEFKKSVKNIAFERTENEYIKLLKKWKNITE